MATPLQQAKCELLAFPWTPDVLAMCNLLAASASEMADVKRSYEAQAKGDPGASHQTSPFNCLLMPELASLQDGAPPWLTAFSGLLYHSTVHSAPLPLSIQGEAGNTVSCSSD